jgi:transposase-like protein
METINCPRCKKENMNKSGFVRGRQRYKCKDCDYFFSVMKEGKNIDNYYVIKALQLYIEGVSLREIERLIGVSHVSVMNWIKKFNLKAPENNDYHPTYKVMRHDEMIAFMSNREHIKNAGMIITELGDKFMLIKWERLKSKGK